MEKIYQINISTRSVANVFNSINDAGDFISNSKHRYENIKNVLQGKSKTTFGYYWIQGECDLDSIDWNMFSNNSQLGDCKVDQIDIQSQQVINTFETIKDAAKSISTS